MMAKARPQHMYRKDGASLQVPALGEFQTIKDTVLDRVSKIQRPDTWRCTLLGLLPSKYEALLAGV